MGIVRWWRKFLGEDPDPPKGPVKTPVVVENRETVFGDPDSPVLGNPHGDVTMVEFIDYR